MEAILLGVTRKKISLHFSGPSYDYENVALMQLLAWMMCHAQIPQRCLHKVHEVPISRTRELDLWSWQIGSSRGSVTGFGMSFRVGGVHRGRTPVSIHWWCSFWLIEICNISDCKWIGVRERLFGKDIRWLWYWQENLLALKDARVLRAPTSVE